MGFLKVIFLIAFLWKRVREYEFVPTFFHIFEIIATIFYFVSAINDFFSILDDFLYFFIDVIFFHFG